MPAWDSNNTVGDVDETATSEALSYVGGYGRGAASLPSSVQLDGKESSTIYYTSDGVSRLPMPVITVLDQA